MRFYVIRLSWEPLAGPSFSRGPKYLAASGQQPMFDTSKVPWSRTLHEDWGRGKGTQVAWSSDVFWTFCQSWIYAEKRCRQDVAQKTRAIIIWQCDCSDKVASEGCCVSVSRPEKLVTTTSTQIQCSSMPLLEHGSMTKCSDCKVDAGSIGLPEPKGCHVTHAAMETCTVQ